MTASNNLARTALNTIAYKQVATGDLLVIECEGLISLQLRNCLTAAKTLTVKSMVQLQVARGILVPIRDLQNLRDLQYLQHMQIARPLHVL